MNMHINPVLTKYREIHVSYIIKMMQKCPYMYFCLNIMTMDIYNAHNEVFGEDKEFLRLLGVLFIKQWSEVCTASLQASMNRRLYWCNEWPSHLHVFISCILGYSYNPQLFLFLVKNKEIYQYIIHIHKKAAISLQLHKY